MLHDLGYLARVHAHEGSIGGQRLLQVGGLVAQRANEYAEHVHFRVSVEHDFGECSRREAVSVEVGVGEHDDYMVVGLLFAQLLNTVLSGLKRVILKIKIINLI